MVTVFKLTGDRAGRWERLYLPLRDKGGGATSKVSSRDPRRGGIKDNSGSSTKGTRRMGVPVTRSAELLEPPV